MFVSLDPTINLHLNSQTAKVKPTWKNEYEINPKLNNFSLFKLDT